MQTTISHAINEATLTLISPEAGEERWEASLMMNVMKVQLVVLYQDYQSELAYTSKDIP